MSTTKTKKNTKATKKPAAAKAKKTQKIKPLKVYSSFGRLRGAAKERKLARGTYAVVSGIVASDLRDARVRFGTPVGGTVFEMSLIDLLKERLHDVGIRFDADAVSLPAPTLASKSAA